MIRMLRHLSFAIVIVCTMVVGAAAFEQGRVWFGGIAMADSGAPVLLDAGLAQGSAAALAPVIVPVPVPALPDPVANPAVALSEVESLYKSGAFVDAAILLAFFALTYASRKVAWLQLDHRAMYVSAILGGLALLAVPASAGTTPNLTMDLTAMITVLGLAMNPRAPAAVANGQAVVAAMASAPLKSA